MISRMELSNVMSLRKTESNAFASNGPVKAAVCQAREQVSETVHYDGIAFPSRAKTQCHLPVSINHQKYCKALNSALATDVAFEPKFAIALKITGQDAKKAVQINDCIKPLTTAEKSYHHSFTQ
jgi:hypothetical protein